MRRLDDLLVEAAEREPAREALVVPGAGSQTYAELLERARHIARILLAHGIRPGDRVGLVCPKQHVAVEAIYGVLLAQATYVPVDSSAPVDRCATILDDCQVRTVLAPADLVAPLQDALAVRFDQAAEVSGTDGTLVVLTTAAQRTTGSADTAYILYTSGSTGIPKGVPVTHTAALSFVDWCSATFDVGPQDRFSSHAPLHFDLSILDLYLCAASAGTLVLIDLATGRQPRLLAPLIAEHRISVWYSTPSILSLLEQAGKLERHDHSSLRYVLFAGEVFPMPRLRALTAAWPHPRYFNLYGPTETNVCTAFEAQIPIPDEREAPLPIGPACSHVETCVLDLEGTPVAAGQEGELCVRGAPVMEGYWNPERNAHVFWPDPGGGPQWYRTGDRVRAGAQGYEFAGRWDRMVKRRGFRVELGEIEARLARHPDLAEVAAVASVTDAGDVEVAAHLCWKAGLRPTLLELRRFCADQLPSAMIPDRFLHVERLPRTSTDKIDYRALSETA